MEILKKVLWILLGVICLPVPSFILYFSNRGKKDVEGYLLSGIVGAIAMATILFGIFSGISSPLWGPIITGIGFALYIVIGFFYIEFIEAKTVEE